MNDKEWKYKIYFSKSGLIAPVFLFALFTAVTVWLYKSNNGAFLFTLIFSVVTLLILIVSVYRTFFIKVLIGEHSFYHKSGIAKGNEYEYSEVVEAWESSVKNARNNNIHYFNYKTSDSTIHKFLFYNYQYDEVEYLLERISGTN